VTSIGMDARRMDVHVFGRLIAQSDYKGLRLSIYRIMYEVCACVCMAHYYVVFQR